MRPVLARLRRLMAVSCTTFVVAAAPLRGEDGCVPDWIPTFGGEPGASSPIAALAVFDDGSGAGPALYVGGGFTGVAGHPAAYVARYDGGGWTEVGGGMNGSVLSLCVFDDGSGPALYAGGTFTSAGGVSANRVARWDGQSWSVLGSGLDNCVRALAVYDDGSGSGPALYAAGKFAGAVGMGGAGAANRIAKWNGQSWSALGGGINQWDPDVHALAVFDDGSGTGPALYAGGKFSNAGSKVAWCIAKWDGRDWNAVGGGMNEVIHALAVFDDGAGPELYAGGAFTSAGGQSAMRLARWDGQVWSEPGGGADARVEELAVCDLGDGSGSGLYAGGHFSSIGGQSLSKIARWDGATWSALGSGVDSAAIAFSVFDDGSGSGPALYAAGGLQSAGGEAASKIARWNGANWSALGTGGVNARVEALVVCADLSVAGPALYASGLFTSAGGLSVNRIARWDGETWSALGEGLGDRAFALAVFDPGSGPALYAGGAFTTAGGQSANYIAKWNGASWSALGSGMNLGVRALAVFDDGSGSGPALYVGGAFTTAGGQSANYVAKWDGQSWSAVGSGLNHTVHALIVFDDGSGSGPALLAGGGSFGGQVAKWTGTTWEAMGSMNDVVHSLAVFDDGSGSGPALYAGGEFTSADGQSANRIARWDGDGFGPVGSGMDNDGEYCAVESLTVFDDGSGAGPALYAGGWFTTAGGEAANRIARWDGQGWSALASGLGGDAASFTNVNALTVFDDGSGVALYAGGNFHLSPAGDSHIARWGCPPSAVQTVPGCFGNPAALTSLSSKLAIGVTFSLSLSSSQISTGLGVLHAGLDGTDAAGCGLFVPGLGELLLGLAPMPVSLGTAPLSAGAVGFDVPVPDVPGWVGLQIAFDGAVVGAFDPGVPIELSNALLATLTQ